MLCSCKNDSESVQLSRTGTDLNPANKSLSFVPGTFFEKGLNIGSV
jgi:hypothetical protein